MKSVLKDLVSEFRPADVVYALAMVGAMYIVCTITSAALAWLGVA